MAEAMGTVHTSGSRLLRRWWPVDLKLVFNQMAAQSRKWWIPPRSLTIITSQS
jgi:hypothetical protein